MFSIVTAAYNIVDMTYDWKNNISNWHSFLEGEGEIIVAVNTSTDNTVKELELLFKQLNSIGVTQFTRNKITLKIINTEFSYEDVEFDGKIKNSAYKAATQKFVIPLDLDEVISLKTKDVWISAALELERNDKIDGYFIASLNVHGSWKNYKDIGQKWYMVKNKPDIYRGIPDFAKNQDGSIDITKSDTTEFCRNGNIINTVYAFSHNFGDRVKINHMAFNRIPFVWHLGGENFAQRLKQNKFWKPVWEARAKKEVNDIILTIDDFNKVIILPHNLKHWSENLI